MTSGLLGSLGFTQPLQDPVVVVVDAVVVGAVVVDWDSTTRIQEQQLQKNATTTRKRTEDMGNSNGKMEINDLKGWRREREKSYDLLGS